MTEAKCGMLTFVLSLKKAAFLGQKKVFQLFVSKCSASYELFWKSKQMKICRYKIR